MLYYERTELFRGKRQTQVVEELIEGGFLVYTGDKEIWDSCEIEEESDFVETLEEVLEIVPELYHWIAHD